MAATTKTPTTKPGQTERVESRATVRHLGVSPNKVRPVLDLVRSMSAEDAERVLQLQPRTAAGHVLKLLESAIANAEHNQQIPIDELFLSRCWCDEGPTRKWGQARARGRYFRVRKRSSHVTIILARFSDEELRTRRGRDEVAGAAGAGGRLARRRADRVRASRASARGETIEEHDHDHDHDHDDAVVTEVDSFGDLEETTAADEAEAGAGAADETSAGQESEADADATMTGAGAADETSAGQESEADADATMTGAGAADETSAGQESEADADATMKSESE
jgi:large subunit ribosomal protein L22